MRRCRFLVRTLLVVALLAVCPAWATTVDQLCPRTPGTNPACTCTTGANCACTILRDTTIDPDPAICQGGGRNGLACATDQCPAGTCQTQRVCRGGDNSGEICDAPTDCPRGICAERTCLAGTNQGRACAANSDCPGSACGSLCQLGSSNGRSCTTDDCPAGTCSGLRDSILDFTTRGNCGLIVSQGRILQTSAGGMRITARDVALRQFARLKAPGPGIIRVQTTGPVDIAGGGMPAGGIDVSGAIPGAISVKTAPGNITVSGVLDASTATAQSDGGVIIVDGANAVTVTPQGRVNASGGAGGFGGDITMLAAGRLQIDGPINAAGSEFGGGLLDLEAGGDLVLSATSDLNINGDTGDAFISAGGLLTARGPIRASGIGTEACGADVELRSVGDLLVELGGPQKIDLSGAACGGSFFASSQTGNARISGLVDARGGAVGDGGEITATAGNTITVQNDLLADGTFAGGFVSLFGCAVNVVSGADLSARGTGGANLLQAGGQIDVAGTLAAGTSNTLERLDQTKVPRCAGAPCGASSTNVNPRPVVRVNATLPPCPGASTTTSTSTTTTTTTTTTGGGGSSTTQSTSSSSTQTTGSSTTRPSTTATTTSSTSSTSSTTLDLTCDPPSCDDADRCTEDACNVGTCTHAAKREFEAVDCRLDGIDEQLLAVEGSLKGKLQARARKIRSKVNSRKFGNLKSANKLLGALSRTVGKAVPKGKIEPTVGAKLQDLATGAQSNLLPLIKK